MTRRLRERPLLAPSRHAAVDQARVPGEALRRTDAEPLRDARSVALDQDICLFDHAQQALAPVGVLQVDRHRASTPGIHDEACRLLDRVDDRRPLDAHDLGAHVGQERPCERGRPERRQLQNFDARQRSHSR